VSRRNTGERGIMQVTDTAEMSHQKISGQISL
jgi:hypothetical protein